MSENHSEPKTPILDAQLLNQLGIISWQRQALSPKLQQTLAAIADTPVESLERIEENASEVTTPIEPTHVVWLLPEVASMESQTSLTQLQKRWQTGIAFSLGMTLQWHTWPKIHEQAKSWQLDEDWLEPILNQPVDALWLDVEQWIQHLQTTAIPPHSPAIGIDWIQWLNSELSLPVIPTDQRILSDNEAKKQWFWHQLTQ